MKAGIFVAVVVLISFAVLGSANVIKQIHKLNGDANERSFLPHMGTFLTPAPVELPLLEIEPSESIPTTFDARTQWPGCIGPVLNQAECGSCWAFGCAETLSDRFCIHSNSTIHVALSELDLVACDKLDDGCQGGWPASAWQYAMRDGLVTNACIPYNQTIPTCPPQDQPCLNFVPTPPCPRKCSDGESWDSVLHYAASGYAVGSSVKVIQTEMLNNGPVQATMNVFEDFLNYTTGVYKHRYGRLMGGHSIKIIGWGVQDNEDYWLVQNSWTASWGGLGGYFMILRGVNECGIEAGIYAGLPKLD